MAATNRQRPGYEVTKAKTRNRLARGADFAPEFLRRAVNQRHTMPALAKSVKVSHDQLQVRLNNGRSISSPLAWYPRLLHATPEERQDWRLIGQGRGIHWESIDEDISVEDVIAGRTSNESQSSLKRWLSSRRSRTASRSANVVRKVKRRRKLRRPVYPTAAKGEAAQARRAKRLRR
jgi:uncharacterized protein DUF2442